MLGSFGCQHGLLLTKDPKIVRYYNVLLDIMVPKEGIEQLYVDVWFSSIIHMCIMISVA